MSRSRGQSVLYAVVLIPTLMLVFALAVDVATLQMQKLRLRYAVDLATVTAAMAIDSEYYSRTGRLQLDPTNAALTAREYLLRNLDGLPDISSPEAITSGADITVINRVPARDPYTGMTLDRPAVCARIHVPHRFSVLGWIGVRTVELTVAANAEIRV